MLRLLGRILFGTPTRSVVLEQPPPHQPNPFAEEWHCPRCGATLARLPAWDGPNRDPYTVWVEACRYHWESHD